MVIMVLLLLLKMNECVLRAQACQRAAHIKMHKITNYLGSDPRRSSLCCHLYQFQNHGGYVGNRGFDWTAELTQSLTESLFLILRKPCETLCSCLRQ